MKDKHTQGMYTDTQDPTIVCYIILSQLWDFL
jgi:hypothetical protein